MRKARILFLAANPEDTDRLALDEEFREVEARLRSSAYRNRFDLVHWPAARRAGLAGDLLRFEPDILHFAGHGSPAGELIFVGQEGQSATVAGEALGHLFDAMRKRPRLVVLNACWSDEEATVISMYVDFVVGMRAGVDDRAAITFAAQLYEALGEGREIQEAFNVAVATMEIENLPQAYAPQLLARDPAKREALFAPQPTEDSSPAQPAYRTTFTEGRLTDSWHLVDPLDDCRLEWLSTNSRPVGSGDTVSRGLRMHVHGPMHDLFYGTNFNAPRILRPMSGPGTIQTRVECHPVRRVQGAGLLVWRDEQNFWRVMNVLHGPSDDHDSQYIMLEGANQGEPRIVGRAKRHDLDQHLRITLRAGSLKAFYFQTAKGWQLIGSAEFDSNAPYEVGVAAVAEWEYAPFYADFRQFTIGA